MPGRDSTNARGYGGTDARARTAHNASTHARITHSDLLERHGGALNNTLSKVSSNDTRAKVCSNNTGELSAFCEALLWLRDEPPARVTAALRYDSRYAANIATGAFKAAHVIVL
jgi:hypothetical protein